MALTKDDLNQIRQVVKEEVGTVVGSAEERIKTELRGEIQASEERVVARINREVTDLAEVNQAVLNEISGPAGMKASIVRIEKPLELAPLKS